VRAEVDKRAVEAIEDMKAGHLRGAKARRKFEALTEQLRRAMDALRVTCPTCGTRVMPEKIRAASRGP
jgi:hypothetical protein